MDKIINLESRIFENQNTFSFSANVKTIQLFVLNLLLTCNDADMLTVLFQRIDQRSNFNSFTFLRQYAINTYFAKMYNDTAFKAIMLYFKNSGYLNNNSRCNAKLLRYIDQKLNKNIFRLTVYLDKKNKIKNII